MLLKGNAEPPAEDINRRNGEKNPVSFYCDFAPGDEWHVGEFLMSIGFLPGAHRPSCPVYRTIARQRPAWMTASAARKK